MYAGAPGVCTGCFPAACCRPCRPRLSYYRRYGVVIKGLARAQSFLHLASQHSPGDPADLRPHLLQQAAEPCFQEFIKALTGKDDKTHDINILKKHAHLIPPGLCNFFPAVTPDDQWLLSLLDKAYLDTRYAALSALSPADFSLLLERITRFHQKTQPVFEEKINTLKNIA